MLPLRAIWEGDLPLNYIQWGLRSSFEYILPPSEDKKRLENWESHLQQFSSDYDGKLIFITSLQRENSSLIIDTGFIRFSTVVYMATNNFHITTGIGMMGVQSLVFSPNMTHILVGERAKTQNYYPGITTIPGGILEISDLDNSPKKALLREIREEVSLSLDSNVSLLAVLSGWNNVSVTFLISTKVSKHFEFKPLEQFNSDQNEWEGNLRWITVEQLKTVPSSQLLDGLTYFRSKLP